MVDAGHWLPQWIGGDGRRLYAALHPARAPASRCGVLLVPPLLHEQLRSRRMLTQIAIRLADAGIACLRFDFLGSGDSDGRGDCMDLASMREDIGIAVEALRASAGVSGVAALAFRGGALPLSSWLAMDGDIERAVFWEPIVDGAGWMDELADAHAAELRSPARYPGRRGLPMEGSDLHLMGFEVSSRLRRDLAGVQASADGWRNRPAAWGVLRPGVALPSLRLQRAFELPTDAARMGDGTRMDGALFVSPGLQRVVDTLAKALTQPQPQLQSQPMPGWPVAREASVS
jgi:hypothetical protein